MNSAKLSIDKNLDLQKDLYGIEMNIKNIGSMFNILFSTCFDDCNSNPNEMLDRIIKDINNINQSITDVISNLE